MGNFTRGMALRVIFVFFVATAIGSVLPEFGNLLAKRLAISSHAFNVVFLIVGIIGISLALYLGLKKGR